MVLLASVLLAAAGCYGLAASARGHWWGWAVNLAVHSTWAVLAVATHDVNRFVPSLMYAAVYTRNVVKWRRARVRIIPEPAR